jgi:hypothetical protein
MAETDNMPDFEDFTRIMMVLGNDYTARTQGWLDDHFCGLEAGRDRAWHAFRTKPPYRR